MNITSFRKNITKEELNSLYWKQKFSMARIAGKFGLCESTVHKRMVDFRIPRRSRSEALMGHPVSQAVREKLRKFHIGLKASVETKAKISRAQKGKPKSFEHRRKIGIALRENTNGLGKHRSEEQKQRYRLVQLGEKNSNWKDGRSARARKIRALAEYRLWREAVLARDGWVCQKCSSCDTELHAHHILNFTEYPEFRYAIDNGITFCENCHKIFHKKYGYENNTKVQLEEFLNGQL